jgi:hypothetical protein
MSVSPYDDPNSVSGPVFGNVPLTTTGQISLKIKNDYGKSAD